MAEQRSIMINRPEGAFGYMVRADYTRLTQAFLNLLSNAIKYNVPEGKVDVSVELKAPSMARISIADNGPGIPEDRHSELFQPFSRLGAEALGIEGTGIGLSLARRLVEMMGGVVEFESKPGSGSTFWIDIPVGERAAPKSIDLRTETGRLKKVAIAPASAGAYKILYVEDNPANLALMQQIVAGIDEAVLTSAHSAELGLDLAAADPPDVILMDINLPEMSGLEALQRLKNRTKLAHIPVIAVTADAMQASIDRGMEAGFHTYLAKPIRFGEILALLEGLRLAPAAISV